MLIITGSRICPFFIEKEEEEEDFWLKTDGHISRVKWWWWWRGEKEKRRDSAPAAAKKKRVSSLS